LRPARSAPIGVCLKRQLGYPYRRSCSVRKELQLVKILIQVLLLFVLAYLVIVILLIAQLGPGMRTSICARIYNCSSFASLFSCYTAIDTAVLELYI